MIHLFQIMLPDGYAEISKEIAQTHPYCYWFFIPFIIIMTFIVLNLFFSLIVTAMQKEADAQNRETGFVDPITQILNKVHSMEEALKQHLKASSTQLQSDKSKSINKT